MSILILGMEMPIEVTSVEIGCDADGYPMAIVGEDIYDVIPVPEHGRLIDADSLLCDLLFPSKQFEQGMRELIGDAPTIIPADGKDTDVPTIEEGE